MLRFFLCAGGGGHQFYISGPDDQQCPRYFPSSRARHRVCLDQGSWGLRGIVRLGRCGVSRDHGDLQPWCERLVEVCDGRGVHHGHSVARRAGPRKLDCKLAYSVDPTWGSLPTDCRGRWRWGHVQHCSGSWRVQLLHLQPRRVHGGALSDTLARHREVSPSPIPRRAPLSIVS